MIMIKLLRRAVGAGVLVGLLIIGGAASVGAQGPFSAQIQAALRVFLTQAHTWTGIQTFSSALSSTTSITAPLFIAGTGGTMTINGATVTSQYETNVNTQAVFEAHTFSATASAVSAFYGARARGTIASPTIVQNGDALASFAAVGHNGSAATAYSLGGYMNFVVAAVPGAADMPTDWHLALSPDGSQTPTDRLVVKSDGTLTMGRPTLTAGTGTQTYRVGGTIFSESPGTSTAADNNYIKTTSYSLAANTLIVDQDQLEVDLVLLESAEATDSRSYTCNYGFTSWTAAGGFVGGVNLMSNATASASVNIHVRSFIKRVSAGTFHFWSESLVGGSYQNTVWQTSAALTLTDAQSIACEVRDSDGTPVAGASTIEEFHVRFFPYF